MLNKINHHLTQLIVITPFNLIQMFNHGKAVFYNQPDFCGSSVIGKKNVLLEDNIFIKIMCLGGEKQTIIFSYLTV